MLPFDDYPHRGRVLLGRLTAGTGSSRTGYGLALQRLTGQTACAYCGVDLVTDYYRWLLLTVDHVVPAGEARRLGIPGTFSEDAMNRVLACAGCNGYLNRYRCQGDLRAHRTVEQFVELRDWVFEERRRLLEGRRQQEMALFGEQPWSVASTTLTTPSTPSSLARPVDTMESRDRVTIFLDDDGGYRAWLAANPGGLVINSYRIPSANYLRLHQATCRTIDGDPSRGSRWTADYLKACAADIGSLHEWARRRTGGTLIPCRICRPLSGTRRG
ncbi:MAG: hypothetical protein GEU28_13520 [Dehalococcoidia bacterium]|nr:hypothetical protein [Dehalococcoidia bacterium]